ncbi:25S rRNA (adenine645-N1)-methyltransferase ASCRUDRAFT_74378, partial [Ascoidea rubescens DSM 1968]
MALFKVNGWDLKEDVKFGSSSEIKNDKKKNKEKKDKRVTDREVNDRKDFNKNRNEFKNENRKDYKSNKNENKKDYQSNKNEMKSPKRTNSEIDDDDNNDNNKRKVKRRRNKQRQDKTEKSNSKLKQNNNGDISGNITGNENDKVGKDGNKKKKEIGSEVVNKVGKPVSTLTPLQRKMMAKLSGSRFRYINEQLYTISSQDAFSMLKNEPALFDAYHEGFRSQVQSWPQNPVDVFVEQFRERAKRNVNAPGGLPGLSNKSIVVADMGCGEAELEKHIMEFVKVFNSKKSTSGFNKFKRNNKFKSNQKLEVKIHSFDLKKANERITVADISNVPLANNSCSIVIFCLALMGNNFLDFIKEAWRILAPNGELWIAEIKSRFTDTHLKFKNRIEDDEMDEFDRVGGLNIEGSENALKLYGEKFERQRSSGKQEQSESQMQSQGQEFINVLKLLGFFYKNKDDSNKMFIRFEFFKPSQEILEERKAKLERRKKFIEIESEREELDKRREK